VVEVIGEKIKLDNDLIYPINSLGVVENTNVEDSKESYSQNFDDWDFDDWKDEELEVEHCDMCAGCTEDCKHSHCKYFYDPEFREFVKINDEVEVQNFGKEKTVAAPYPECIDGCNQEESKNVEIKESCSVQFNRGTLFITRNKNDIYFEYSSYERIDDVSLNKKDVEAIISFLSKVVKNEN
jgi:hypothetical protein